MIEIAFQEGDSKGFENLLKEHIEKPLKHFEKELAAIRTGRASIALLENIKVEAYGQLMSLKELATLGAPDSRLLTVQPWDKGIIPEIEKAIATSDLAAPSPSPSGYQGAFHRSSCPSSQPRRSCPKWCGSER